MSIECTEFKPFVKNTLQGFCTLRMEPSGIVIKECSVHEKNGQRWISFPGKPWTDREGKTAYRNIIEIASRKQADQFRDAALKAIDQFIAGGNGNDEAF